MKNLKLTSALLFSFLYFSAFCSNQPLKQEAAEQAIFWFRIDYVTSDTISLLPWKVVLKDVGKPGSVRQASPADAYCTVLFPARVAVGDPSKECSYIETELTIEFHFKMNQDEKWFLEGIAKCSSKAKVNDEHLSEFAEKNKLLNTPVE